MTALSRRAIYLGVHKWVGFLLGLYILLMGLTGALLVYRREIEALQDP